MDEKYFKRLSMQLDFNCIYINEKDNPPLINYSSSYFMLYLKDSSSNDMDPIIFHTFSDKGTETTSEYSIIKFYVLFILVIGNFMRSLITGEEMKVVMTEMPDPSKLLQLCEGIKIARYENLPGREEVLYYVLIDFLRSPEFLKTLTKSSVKYLKMRRENQLSFKFKSD